MSKSLLDILADKLIKDLLEALGGSDRIGARGERLTEKELKWLKLFSKNGLTLKNIIMTKQARQTLFI